MASKEYQIIVSAVGKGIKATTRSLSEGFTRGQKAVAAFNATARKSKQTSDRLMGSIKGLIGAYAGWQSVMQTTRIIKEADQATFNMASSVAAANREFDDTGSVADWDMAITRLSDRLMVYSDTALKNAISRTVDMTKRLGLEKDQMEELIVRAGDLGAGKVSLEGAIERVSAAMRGEAESAEYLGLTLNENYVKACYEASAATDKAWAKLTDVEKAQARYAVFLEQTNEMQGRAAQSAETLGGAWELAKKQAINAVANNRDAADSMNELADTLRENADEIGNTVSTMVSLGAKAAQFAVKWRKVILAVVGTSVGVAALTKLLALIQGVNAAFVMLTGVGIIKWFGLLRTALVAVEAQFLAGSVAASAFYAVAAAGAIWGITKIIELGAAVWEAKKAYDATQASLQRMYALAGKVQEKYKKFKDVKVPDDLTAQAQQDLEKLHDELIMTRAYWMALVIELERKSKDKKLFGGVFTDEARAAQKELRMAKLRLAEVKHGLAEIESSGSFEKVNKAIAASPAHLEAFKKSAEAAYKSAKKEAEDYADKVKSLNEAIADREISLADKIRDLRRQGMDAAAQTSDLRSQALEKEEAAQEALNQAAQTGSDRQLELARRFAQEAESAWTSYANSGGDAVETAISGLERVNASLDKADKIQIDTFSKLRDDARKAMTDIEAMVKHIEESVEMNIPVELANLETVRKQINDLIRDETKHITIEVSEKRAAGGRVGMASGGRFPGNSKTDSVHVMARPGEGFVRNEALAIWDKRFGKGFFDAINAPWSKAGQSIISALTGGRSFRLPSFNLPEARSAYAAGGRVSAPAAPADMGTININVGNGSFPVGAPVNVLGELKQALSRQAALRRNE